MTASRYLCFVPVLLAAATTLADKSLPAPLPAEGKLINSLQYSNATEARQSWKPIYGSVPVNVAGAGERNVLKFPCVFQGNKLERGTWEWAVDLDLNACRGVQFQFYCEDLSPISAFTLYFQTGNGWYGLNFNPEYAGRWCRVVLDKTKAIPEGVPAGWGKIRTIRFSAWRGYDTNTDVYLADLALAGADAPVVVARSASAGRTGQAVTAALQRFDIPYFVIADNELQPSLITGRSLLVLLGSPKLSADVVKCVEGFTRAGGKVICFGTPPSEIKSIAGVQSASLPAGDAADPSLAIMTTLGKTAPSLWAEAVKQAIARSGTIAGYGSLEEATKAIRQAAGKNPDKQKRVEAQMERAAELRKRAESHAGSDPEQALLAAEQARAAMTEAYCVAQSPRPDEHRAFWCHSALGVEGMSWDESIRVLADNGFTAILPNMLWAGVAYYESEVLPEWPELASRGNQLESCLAACKKYGIQCHVWKVNWYMSGRSPRAFLDRMKQEGRTQVNFDGSGKDDWLCPSHPANRQLEIDSMVELATKYDVDGIHFDYIRYPGLESCFCAGCRQRFEESIGQTVANWPADTRQNAAIKEKWLEWRRSNITAVVAGTAERLRANKPNVKISAAVFRIWPVDRDGVAQDWKLWCEKGYLDFVCPMDYTPNVPQFRDMIRHQQEWAGKVPCYPGIGASVWPERNDICRLIDQINVTRELNTGGFTVFNYAVDEARVILPMLGKGTTQSR